MTYYEPRMLVELSVPYLGTAAQRAKLQRSDDIITVLLPVREISIENNDHNHADSCTVVVDWLDTTLDTRMLDDGVVTVYVMQAEKDGSTPTPTVDDVVFIGHVRNPERTLAEGEPSTLSIECIDYTGLFLEAKPFGSKGIPDYSQTLWEAWQRIVSQTPGAQDVFGSKDAFVCMGTANPDIKLGSAVSERFTSLAKVPTHPDTDAWAVWQQCVGMLGFVSYIDQDVVVVTSSTNLTTERDPPVFTWGANLTSLSESRMNIDVKGGIGLVCFDPTTNKAVEAFYPPIGDERVHRKTTSAKRKKALPLALSSERNKRHLFTIQGVTTQEHLEMLAQRVWLQIARQELLGKLETPHMFVRRSATQRLFNTMKLKSGDSIVVDFDEGAKQYLTSLPSELERVRYLTGQGYPRDIATLLARNAAAFAALDSVFYVESVRKRISVDENGGEFNVEVSFQNMIDITKGAVGLGKDQDSLIAKKKDLDWTDGLAAALEDSEFETALQPWERANSLKVEVIP